MRRIDAFVDDPAKHPYHGWHDHGDIASRPDYQPVIQQVRAEYEEFLRRVIAMNLHGLAVQIGLGICGGSHFALRQVFERVVTIECNPENLERFKSFYTIDPQRDIMVLGNSFDPGMIQAVRNAVRGADLLFIDGGHLFDDVRRDWENYRGIVRSGGLVCFHDHVPRPARYHELQIDIFLTWLELQPFKPAPIERIGNTLGISYYVVP